MSAKPTVTVWGSTSGPHAADADAEVRLVRDRMVIVARQRQRVQEIGERWGLVTLDATPLVPCTGGYVPAGNVQIVLYAEPFEKVRYFTAKPEDEIRFALEVLLGMGVEVRGRGTYFHVDLEANGLVPLAL